MHSAPMVQMNYRNTNTLESLPKTVRIMSIPACRKTLRAEKNDRYFDFKHLKICAHLDISYNFL